MKALLCLALVLNLSSAYADKAGTDKCEVQETVAKNEYALILKKASKSKVNVVAVSPVKRPRKGLESSYQNLGNVDFHQLDSLAPWKRYAASAATGAVAVGAVATGGVLVVGAFSVITPASTLAAYLGAGAIASTSAAQVLDAANPVAQFERANTEKCLKKLSGDLKSAKTEKIMVIKMNDKDDFKDTVGQIKDLIHDLK